VDLELARQQWGDGYRRLEERRGDRGRYERLLGQVDAVTAELRRRVGQTFTLGELAAVYDGADAWAREAVEDADEERDDGTSDRERARESRSTPARRSPCAPRRGGHGV